MTVTVDRSTLVRNSQLRLSGFFVQHMLEYSNSDAAGVQRAVDYMRSVYDNGYVATHGSSPSFRQRDAMDVDGVYQWATSGSQRGLFIPSSGNQAVVPTMARVSEAQRLLVTFGVPKPYSSNSTASDYDFYPCLTTKYTELGDFWVNVLDEAASRGTPFHACSHRQELKKQPNRNFGSGGGGQSEVDSYNAIRSAVKAAYPTMPFFGPHIGLGGTRNLTDRQRPLAWAWDHDFLDGWMSRVDGWDGVALDWANTDYNAVGTTEGVGNPDLQATWVANWRQLCDDFWDLATPYFGPDKAERLLFIEHYSLEVNLAHWNLYTAEQKAAFQFATLCQLALGGCAEVFDWQPEGANSGTTFQDYFGLFNKTAIGSTSSLTGLPNPKGDAVKAFHDLVPPDTPIYDVDTGDSRVYGIATDTQTAIVNLKSTSFTDTIEGSSVTVDPYSYEIVPAESGGSLPTPALLGPFSGPLTIDDAAELSAQWIVTATIHVNVGSGETWFHWTPPFTAYPPGDGGDPGTGPDVSCCSLLHVTSTITGPTSSTSILAYKCPYGTDVAMGMPDALDGLTYFGGPGNVVEIPDGFILDNIGLATPEDGGDGDECYFRVSYIATGSGLQTITFALTSEPRIPSEGGDGGDGDGGGGGDGPSTGVQSIDYQPKGLEAVFLYDLMDNETAGPDGQRSLPWGGGSWYVFNDYNGLAGGDGLSGNGAFYVHEIGGIDDADVRDSREVRPSRHGEDAYNALYGGRTLTFTGELRAKNLRQLRRAWQELRWAFVDLKEHYLVFYNDYMPNDVMIKCRKSTAMSGREVQDRTYWKRDVLLTLRASEPWFVSRALHSTSLVPTESFILGRTYDRTFDWQYTDFLDSDNNIVADTDTDSFEVVNAGNFETYPVIELQGPMSYPIIQCRNPTAGVPDQTMYLTMDILDGQTVIIDIAGRTVKDADGSNLFPILNPISDWISLAPSLNLLSITVRTFDSGSDAGATVFWRDAWM